MIRDAPDPLVEFGVELGVADRVALLGPLPHLIDRPTQLTKVGSADSLRRMSHDQLLERDANLLDLERLAVGDEPHSGAAVRLERDQALLVEPDKGSADCAPSRLQERRELRLDEPLIGVEAAAHDLIAQLAVGIA